MCRRTTTAILCVLLSGSVASAEGESDWWDPDWHYRTTVVRATPWRDSTPRPVEAVIDFPLLLKQSGVAGQFDPASLRVVQRTDDGPGREVPCAYRTEFDARAGRQQSYLSWIAQPELAKVGAYDVYFDTEGRHAGAGDYDTSLLPPENLLANPGFEKQSNGLPTDWTATPTPLIRLGKFSRTSGQRSLAVVVDAKTPEGVGRKRGLAHFPWVGTFSMGRGANGAKCLGVRTERERVRFVQQVWQRGAG